MSKTMMHSPRQAAMRPSSPLSPLSPRFDTSSRYQTLQPPSSARSYGPRSTSSTQQRRNHGTHLALPGLPRFHPANFPSSQSSSVGNTPGSGPISPQMSLSPQMQQKMANDVQKQLYYYQQEILARGGSQSNLREKPVSPRLEPLGSPGPVTPLELEEEEDNYLAAGSRAARAPTVIEGSDELSARMSKPITISQSSRAPRATNRST